MTWLLAWRNLWRHTRRTWLTVGAMVFCNVLLVFLISLQLGSYQMMIDGSLSAFTGHIQIQHEQYQAHPKIRNTVSDSSELVAHLRQLSAVEAAAPRLSTYALVSDEDRSSSSRASSSSTTCSAEEGLLLGLLASSPSRSSTVASPAVTCSCQL